MADRTHRTKTSSIAVTLRMNHKATLPGCVLLLVCCGLSGCQALRERTASASKRTKELLTWNDQKETDPNQKPEKMVAIWSESIIYGPDSRPTRGLGGRIYFYNVEHQAVPVTGELTVYAYDDQKNEDKTQPDRKYVISAEQFQEHHSPSELRRLLQHLGALGSGRRGAEIDQPAADLQNHRRTAHRR